ncbi:MAG: translation initiation factor IF-2 [Lentisphaeria bacterium]|nr:translation initiation factor IF-2 [Lentisphaeria bacterium]
MATTPIKVKAFADKYGLTSKEVLKELAAQGYDNIRTASNNMPMEDLPLIESYFDELMEKRNPQSALIEEVESRMESRSGGQNKNKKRSGEEQNQGGKRDKNFGKGGKFPPRDNGSSADIPAGGEIHIKPPVVVKALADAMGKRPNEVISSLMMMNVLASINQTIDTEIAQKVAEKMGFTLVVDSKRDKDEHQKKEETEEVDPEDMEYDDSPKDLKPRPPIVTFMGHVDHGKTSLQDAIRKTHVAAGEAGGITQHIGASSVVLDGKAITFVDTPGHEAFTQMRARGANVTDIVVLVVAADDGFMPQTIEAMNHALAAKVPIVVAMNKCDLPDADTQKILLHMQQNNLMSEDWGGTVAAIPVSAKTGAGIDDLLERILLEAEMLELQANAKRPGLAYVLESQLEQGLGATASVVVKNGSLRVGDPIICGEYYGKIKTLIDFRGKRVAVAPPSTPVKVVGLSGVPEAGTKMAVCKNINEAKQLAETRSDSNRIEALSSKTAGASLEDLFSQMDDSKKNSLKVIVKSDVRGSSEAIVESLKKLPSEKISVDVLHTGVGAITENDVLLAASSDAIVVGFHVRVNPGVNDLAKKSNVEIRLYSIIYELIEDITDALAGRLEPEKREKDIGTVKILKIFQLSKGPKICGCMVEKGVARTGAKARVFRNNELIFNGEVRSLRRYQDDVKEVHQGLECGIRLDNFMDFTEGDIIQLYEIELKKATLT